jgi:hypothetical protein
MVHVGVAVLPEGRSGNTRTDPGNYVVLVDLFLEVLLGYAALPSATSVVEILWKAHRLLAIFLFVEPPMSAFVFIFLFHFFVSLGHDVLFASTVVSVLYRSVVIY